MLLLTCQHLLAGVEFGLFLLPISIIHYLPNFFFGSLLMLFGVEILMDWLIYSFKKVSTEQGLVTKPAFYYVAHPVRPGQLSLHHPDSGVIVSGSLCQCLQTYATMQVCLTGLVRVLMVPF